MTPSAALKRLGLAAGADVPAIRKAYAQRLKAMDVDADPPGYARLREARDTALRAAKTAASAPPLEDTPPVAEAAPEQETQLKTEPDPPWAYAAPSFPLALEAGVPLLIEGRVPHPQPDPIPAQAIDAPTLAPAARLALAGPPVIAASSAARAPALSGVTLLPHPDRDLARLLHAREDGEDAPPGPLSDSEEAFAERCLAVLLADAATSDLTRHGLMEDWLADLIADTWPRSAPLLKATAGAFGWENERGQLRERRSIAWLNARLRGLRFHEKVTKPDHLLHDAWAELSRPGRANMLDRWRVYRSQVNQLLEGVRKHFPELEQHLAPDRVASWEAGNSKANNVGNGAGRTGIWRNGLLVNFGFLGSGFSFNFGYAFFVVVGLQVLGAIIRMVPGGPVDPNPLLGPPALTAPADPHYARIRDAAISEVFGPGKTIDWLREKQASLSSEFEARLRASRAQGRGEPGVVADALEFVRLRVLLDGRDAGGPFLLETMAVRLAQLDAASKQGPEFCVKVIKMADTQELTLPDPVRAQEQALAAELVEAGLLIAPRPPAVNRADIPGALIGQVIDATGLPEKRVRQAIQNSGTLADQCKVTRALLRAALKWQGNGHLTLLRVL